MQQVFPTPSHPLRSDIWASGLYTLYCVAWSASKMDSWTLPEITSNQEAHQLQLYIYIYICTLLVQNNKLYQNLQLEVEFSHGDLLWLYH